MTEEEVAAFSNLSLENARRAKAREYTEPFLVDQRESVNRLGGAGEGAKGSRLSGADVISIL